MSWLPALPDALTAWLATWWLHATVLASGGWLVLRHARELSPRVEQALVVFVLVAPWLTASMAAGAQVADEAPASVPVASEGALAPPVLAERPVKGASPRPTPRTSRTFEAAPSSPVPRIAPEAAAAPTATRTRPLAPAAAAAILRALLGASGLVVLVGIVRDRRAARALRALDHQPLDEPLATLAHGLVARVGGAAHRVRWAQTDDLPTPLTHGVRMPLVLVPRRAAELPSDEQLALLAHELAHVVRRDALRAHLVRAAARLALLVPFASAVARRWSPAVERAADDVAAAWTGNRRALASCLVRVSGWHDARRMPLAATAMADRPPHLQVRVERLLASPVRGAGALTVLILVSAGAGLGTVAFAAAPTARPASLTPDATTISDEPSTAALGDPLESELSALDTELDELLSLARRARPNPHLDAALDRLAARRHALRQAADDARSSR
ncbi:MAG: M56 family metallopeptidase [Planctomycetota bacterium]